MSCRFSKWVSSRYGRLSGQRESPVRQPCFSPFQTPPKLMHIGAVAPISSLNRRAPFFRLRSPNRPRELRNEHILVTPAYHR